jgi:hypothetical protein
MQTPRSLQVAQRTARIGSRGERSRLSCQDDAAQTELIYQVLDDDPTVNVTESIPECRRTRITHENPENDASLSNAAAHHLTLSA